VAERLVSVWVGYLSKYLCRERNLVQCDLRERWMRAYDVEIGVGIAIGLYLWIGCLGWILLGDER